MTKEQDILIYRNSANLHIRSSRIISTSHFILFNKKFEKLDRNRIRVKEEYMKINNNSDYAD